MHLSSAQPSRIKSTLNGFALFFWVVLMVPIFIVIGLVRPGLRQRLVHVFHRGLLRFFNLELTKRGEPVDTPTLFVCNHLSYLDVFVLGSCLSGRFVAKSNVARWPILGKLAKLQDTIFIERNPRRAAEQVTQLRELLAGGDSLIVFPEGTSTPGTLVHNFKSSLFAAADVEGVVIQPVTIAYTHYEDVPMSQGTRDRYAWYLPMAFTPHFFTALGLGRATMSLSLHKAVRLADFPSRKACAAYCEQIVRERLLADLQLEKEIIPERYQLTLSKQ